MDSPIEAKDTEPDFVKLDSEALSSESAPVLTDATGNQDAGLEDENERPDDNSRETEHEVHSTRDSSQCSKLGVEADREVIDKLESHRPTRHEMDEEKTPEWAAMPQIPEHWRPLPLFLVRNVPLNDKVKEEDVQKLVEQVEGLKVYSVAFDDRPNEKLMGRCSALVRLQPLAFPDSQEKYDLAADTERPKVEAMQSRDVQNKPPKDGDVLAMASWAVHMLKSHAPALELGGESVAFEVSSLQVQLYIGNLSSEWQQDPAFTEAMAKFGALERAFVMRNAAGHSKGYGFVEFSLPGSALACKQAMDEIERKMRPDPRKQKDKIAQQQEEEHKISEVDQPSFLTTPEHQKDENKSQALRIAGWPEASGRLVKLLRAEWAMMRNLDVLFSKVLYVTNLRTNTGSQQQLREVFKVFGRIAEVTVPINKATNSTKGFAFVAFTSGLAADRAYRALEKSGSQEIGGALVSFANSAKATDMQGRNNASKQAGLSSRQQTGRAHSSSGRMPLSRTGSQPPAGRMPPNARALGGRGPARIPLPNDGALRQQQLHMQAGMAAHAQMARQMELRMQQQMQAQQVQMQAQLRQAQMQMQQMQQQAQQFQRQAAQAQAKAAAELEARKRVEKEARRVAATPREGLTKRASGQYPGSFSGAAETSRSMGHKAQGYRHPQIDGSEGYSALKTGTGTTASGHTGQPGYGHQIGAPLEYGNQANYASGSHAQYGDPYENLGVGSNDYGYGHEFEGGAHAYGHNTYDARGGYGNGDVYSHQQAFAGYNENNGRGIGEGLQGYSNTVDYNAGTFPHNSLDNTYGSGEGSYDQHEYADYSQPTAAGFKRMNPYQAGYSGFGPGTYGSSAGEEYSKRQRY